MSVNARKEEFEHVELFGKPALFTNSRIDRASVPEGFFCYDLRGSDYDPGRPVTVENTVCVNHAGAVLTTVPVEFQKDKDFRRIRGKLNFLGECLDLVGFCEVHGLNPPSENRKYILRPASPDEAGLFYSQEEKDAELGCVGHLRLDFGRNGSEFWSTWWPHNADELNTPEFKMEFDDFINELRKDGPLQSLSAMSAHCYEMDGKISGQHHSFVAESEQYRYCLRCFPRPGDYNAYIYIYDKRQQELNMVRSKPLVGRITFASGETINFTDPEKYIQMIREELPHRPTSGFEYRTLTRSPQVRKAVDDIIYDLLGEDNPCALSDDRPQETAETEPESRGMTMGGMK